MPTARGSARTPLGAEFRKAAASPVAPQKPTALDQWHVAINDVPVGPMKREEVAKKMESGAITENSLCWREGFDDWRPLKDVAELSALLRRHGPGSHVPGKPPMPPPPARALGNRTSSPPVGARPRPAPPARPAQDAARPAARGNVVPIGGRIGAAAAPAFDDMEGDLVDDEPTRVGAAVDSREARRREAHRREAAEHRRLDRADRGRERVGMFGGPRHRWRLAPIATFAPESEAFDPFASQRASAPMPGMSAQGSSMQGAPMMPMSRCRR
jgi:hypothetical protein